MRTTKTIIGLLAAALLLASAAHAGPAWKSIETKDGIEVFKRDVKGSKMLSFRAVAVISAQPRKVLWVICDLATHKDWVRSIGVSTVLKRVSDHDFIYYQSFLMPWLVDDRDFVVRGKATRRASGVIDVISRSTTWKGSPKTVGVRAELTLSHFVLVPVEGGKKTRVEFEIMGDPKGWIPSWLANQIQGTWPFHMLASLKKQVKKPKVGLYPLPPKS